MTQLFCTHFSEKLPLWTIAALAAVFLLPVPLAVLRRTTGGIRLAVFCAAASAALLWNLGWQFCFLGPVTAHEGETVQLRAVVTRTEKAGESGWAQTELKLLWIGEEKQLFPVTANAYSLPSFEPGDLIEGEFTLSAADPAYDYGKGVFLNISTEGAVEKVGHSANPIYLFTRLQQYLSLKLRGRFVPEIGSVAAAVCVGDRSGLADSIQENYRYAGVAHLLVVSGLHLSLVTGVVGALLPRRRRTMRNLLMIVAVLAFMALTGFTASVIRAGVMALLVCLASLLSESADSRTSLGAAVFLLTAFNPACAADAGLLLSVSATLGILLANEQFECFREQRAQRRREKKKQKTGRLERIFMGIANSIFLSAAAAVATIPVLVAIGGEISLFSVLTNLVAVPLITPVLVFGLLTALTLGVPLMQVPSRVFALLCGGLIRALNMVTSWVADLPFGVIYLQGFYPLAVVLVGIGLMLLLFRLPKGGLRRKASILSAALLLFAVALGTALNAGTVRVALIGYTQQPAVVITEGDAAAILWRGGETNLNAVEHYLEVQKIHRVALLINCVSDEREKELEDRFAPQEYCDAEEDVIVGVTFEPIDGIMISIRRQAEGILFPISVEGATLCCATGKTSFTGEPTVEVFLAGTQQPAGLAARNILAGGQEAEWVRRSGQKILRGEEPTVWIRPGISMKITGVG